MGHVTRFLLVGVRFKNKTNFPDNLSCVWWLQDLDLGCVRVIICLIICSTELGLYCISEKWLKKCSAVHFSLWRLHQKAPQTREMGVLSGFIPLCHILLICFGEQVRSPSFVNQRQLPLPRLNGHFMNIQGLFHLPGKQTLGFPSLSSGWRLRKLSLWRGIGSCQATSSFACKQTPHLHLLYTPSCKVAHPFPHFTKEIRASFGNASQNLLLFMQSSEIWILCKRIPFWFKFFV